jgi:hypothetical protein
VRLPGGRAVRPDQERDEVAVAGAGFVGDFDDRERARRPAFGRPELDCIDEPNRRDRSPLAPVPAPTLEQIGRQRSPDRGLDRGSQSLIITCLTTV